MKYQQIIEQMTLAEKAAFLSGKGEWQTWNFDRLNIPSMYCSDGPSGLRRQAGAGDHLGLNPSLPATCFPSAATVANSWDEGLGEEIGEALGEEAKALGVHILLGPGLNIKRSPLCGRNFEYFSEDPHHAGKMAAAYIRGIQRQGVCACPKHFAVNSQELRRMAMNAVVDERTLREIYLTGFEIAVKEGGAKAIMSSYNEVNGTYANENSHLLQDILRSEWGFDGIVITDWGGSNDHVKGVEAGSDLEMPNPGLDSARQIIKAVREGNLEEKAVNVCVERLLETADTFVKNENPSKEFDQKRHHALAEKAAAESMVLLKNKEEILPLQPGTKVAVIGEFAFAPRYQGAGSSLVNPTRLDTPADLIRRYELDVKGSARGYQRLGRPDRDLEEEAVNLAKTADVVLYFFGLGEQEESEGLDRAHMKMPENQIELLKHIRDVNPNIVGILSAGAAVEMPWANAVKGLLYTGLCGQAGAGAVLDILTGRKNPCGKLNETYPVSYEDTPAFHYYPGKERNAEYREGLYVGYRYYGKTGVKVQFPFGYGLSYTSFAYTDLQVGESGAEVQVTNTGGRDGAEIVQLYIGKETSRVYRPAKELKGFKKVFLKAGESRHVQIPFDERTFRYWNMLTQSWEREEGSYLIMVGGGSEDIRLTEKLNLKGTSGLYPRDKEELPSYYLGAIRQVDDSEFEKLLGTPIPSGAWTGSLGINDAVCQMYYAKSRLARGICRMLHDRIKKNEQNGMPDLNLLFQYNIPFRAIAKMTGGMVSMEMVDGILLAVNGRFLKGTGKIIAGFFKNRHLNRKYARLLTEETKEKRI